MIIQGNDMYFFLQGGTRRKGADPIIIILIILIIVIMLITHGKGADLARQNWEKSCRPLLQPTGHRLIIKCYYIVRKMC